MSHSHALQRQFAKAIRQPESFQADSDDHKRRVAVYQSLFFNNVKGFLSSAFPVLFEILGETRTDALARDFFVRHSCESPYFIDISKEFVEYLSAQPEILSTLPAFSAELAHYEWLELAVSVMKRDNATEENYQKGVFTLSPVAVLASYTFPVHSIQPQFLPESASTQPHCYVVYRDDNEDVCFLTVTPITLVMLSLLEQSESGLTQSQLVALLQQHFEQLEPAKIEKGVHDTLLDMLNKTVVNQH